MKLGHARMTHSSCSIVTPRAYSTHTIIVTHSSHSTVTHHSRSIVTNFRSNTSPLRWSFGGNKPGPVKRERTWKNVPKKPRRITGQVYLEFRWSSQRGLRKRGGRSAVHSHCCPEKRRGIVPKFHHWSFSPRFSSLLPREVEGLVCTLPP